MFRPETERDSSEAAEQRSGKQLLTLLFSMMAIVIFVQFPISCADSNAAPDNGDQDVAAGFQAKVSSDFLTGFAHGFIVQVKPDPQTRVRAVGEALGLPVEREFTFIHAFKTRMTTAQQLRDLVADDAVVWISPDSAVTAASLFSAAIPGPTHVTTGASVVEYETTNNTNFKGTTGQGVTVAVIDSGIYADHADFDNRVVAQVDFTGGNRKDAYGHGTHVAGLIAGNGKMSFQESYRHYLAGIATKANLVNLRVLDQNGAGSVSGVLSALDWVIQNKSTYNIRVVNLSVGVPPSTSYRNDPLAVAAATAVQNGIVVVAAAGNYGVYNGQTIYAGILSPAYSPYVIAVGAVDTHGTDARSDDTMAVFSSRGPTLFDGLPKPDLVAPGVGVKSTLTRAGQIYANHSDTAVSPCSEGACLFGLGPAPEYQRLSGTSMAAPQVAGTVALMLQANPSLTPNAVKAILMATAQALPDQPYIAQGAGLLNVDGAVRLASKITDISQVAVGSPWTFEDVQPSSTIATENVVWSQGVGWTGYTVNGIGTVNTFQPAYTAGQPWGQGVGWTGETTQNIDPVYSPASMIRWNGAVVNPMSLPQGGLNVLGNQDPQWPSPPDFLDATEPGYPQQ